MNLFKISLETINTPMSVRFNNALAYSAIVSYMTQKHSYKAIPSGKGTHYHA